MKKQLLVFTDLDGTLLDHESYSFEPALPQIKRLAQLNIPLVLNSSKTLDEISSLRVALNNQHPFVVENGAAVVVPPDCFSNFPQGHIQYFGPKIEDLLKSLHRIRDQHDFHFIGFADLSPAELADLTGLSLNNAIQAKQRVASEPIQWHDSEAKWESFCIEIAKTGLTLLKGGRFIHVMGKTDKGQGVNWLVQQYRQLFFDKTLITVALGDSPNDKALLEAVDLPVIIPNPKGGGLKSENPNVILASQPGPSGWAGAIEQILEQQQV